MFMALICYRPLECSALFSRSVTEDSPALQVLLQNSALFVAFRSFGSSQTSLKALRLTSFEAKN